MKHRKRNPVNDRGYHPTGRKAKTNATVIFSQDLLHVGVSLTLPQSSVASLSVSVRLSVRQPLPPLSLCLSLDLCASVPCFGNTWSRSEQRGSLTTRKGQLCTLSSYPFSLCCDAVFYPDVRLLCSDTSLSCFCFSFSEGRL
jgi:hypothetical protein